MKKLDGHNMFVGFMFSIVVFGPITLFIVEPRWGYPSFGEKKIEEKKPSAVIEKTLAKANQAEPGAAEKQTDASTSPAGKFKQSKDGRLRLVEPPESSPQ